MLTVVLDELKKIIPDFELRKEQHEMMEVVHRSMKEGLKSAVHAPTGTGKSLGYLLPFLAMKIEYPDFKITISTYTLNLQAQLIKDLELITTLYERLKPLEKALTYTVLKGKNNYYCEKEFIENQDDVPLPFTQKVNDKVASLRANKVPVDKQNLAMKMTPAQWEMISVNDCKRKECPFFTTCDFYQDHYGKESDIILNNHSLYFKREMFVSDAWENFSFHIFDEAHKLEKVILDAMTFDLSVRQVENWAKKGITIAYKYGFDENKITAWGETFLFQNKVVEKFRRGLQVIASKCTTKTTTLEKLKFGEASIFNMVKEIETWQKAMYQSFMEELVPEGKKEDEKLKEDCKTWAMSFGSLPEFFSVLELGAEKKLIWVEKTNFGEVFLKVTPTSVLYMPTLFRHGILFTSGTLAQNETNQHFTDRLNVTIDVDKVLPTPFSLHEQTLVYASRTVNPKALNYEEAITNETYELLIRGELKSFVLFTSIELMQKVHARLKPKLLQYAAENHWDLDVWLQDKTNHINIMDSFKNQAKKSVLFGTLSYFEGIDLQRDALTQVILTRLPFSNPTHPIQEILDQDKAYSKWEASIRFEQAFGRLIRTKEDYGTFAILDNRIYDNYNKEFLRIFEKESIGITDQLENIESFYKNRAK